MSTQGVRSYIWDDVETLPPREMERLQLERLFTVKRNCLRIANGAILLFPLESPESAKHPEKLHAASRNEIHNLRT
jgi:hypothetical protein